MSNNSPNVTMEGQLERLEGNLVRGRLGESTRLHRLCIDGRWYFCKASDFASSKSAGAVLRHAQLPARVTAAPYVAKGRSGLCWLYIHDSGEFLRPVDPFKRGGVVALMILLTAILSLVLFFGWSWVNRLPTSAFVASLPVVIALAVATLFLLVFAVFGLVDVVSLFRSHRLRAFRAYLTLCESQHHGD